MARERERERDDDDDDDVKERRIYGRTLLQPEGGPLKVKSGDIFDGTMEEFKGLMELLEYILEFVLDDLLKRDVVVEEMKGGE